MSPTDPRTPEPLVAPQGWSVLHLFATVPGALDRAGIAKAVAAARGDGYQVVVAGLLGHKADVALMIVGEDLWRLRAFQSEVAGAGLRLETSYVSLTEVSEYAAGVPEEMRRARLYPELPPPDKRAFCFYPMSKRRVADDNWYRLEFERRKELMLGHGAVGRTFRGRVLQLITGSTGLDDWEWGVTLFGRTLEDLKDCVYQMRFDEASARYAEFGPFYVGAVDELDVVLDAVARGTPG